MLNDNRTLIVTSPDKLKGIGIKNTEWLEYVDIISLDGVVILTGEEYGNAGGRHYSMRWDTRLSPRKAYKVISDSLIYFGKGVPDAMITVESKSHYKGPLQEFRRVVRNAIFDDPSFLLFQLNMNWLKGTSIVYDRRPIQFEQNPQIVIKSEIDLASFVAHLIIVTSPFIDGITETEFRNRLKYMCGDRYKPLNPENR